MSKPITVLIADNHGSLRRSLIKILGLNKKIQVIGEAMNGQEAVSKVEELRPAVVLMDVKMPKMDGLKATRHIKLNYPATKVIMLSAYNEKKLIDEAMKSGASTYLIKNRPIEDLIQTIVEYDLDGQKILGRG